MLFGRLASVLTFKKDKLALAVLVDGVYPGWQTPPEHVDKHGITWHYCVVSDPPKPVILKEGYSATQSNRLSREMQTIQPITIKVSISDFH